MPARVTLTVQRGPLAGKTFVFAERTTCVIGRGEDCRLRLPDDPDHRKVSRHHCLLDVNPPDACLRDLGSLNGTYVNGRKIGQRPRHGSAAFAGVEHDLVDGDEITVGGTTLRVTVHVPPVCDGCWTEVPNEQQELWRTGPSPSHYLCPNCRERQEPIEARRPACASCGRDLGARDAHPGECLCEDCRDYPRLVLDRLLKETPPGAPEHPAIEGYSVIRELGKGGMGAVYLARREPEGEPVALKVILPHIAVRARAREMFLREMENTRALRHPNVVALRQAGCSRGVFFFTMEYCEGGSLHQLLRQRGPLAPGEAVPLICQVLDGLEYAHNAELPAVAGSEAHRTKRGLVHRDLSLDNLFLAGNSDNRIVKIGDYGMAKAFDGTGLSGLTRTGTLAGKPGFICRQQVIDFKYARPNVDIWAAAACLFALLTGCVPRDFPPGKDCWQMVLETAPVPVRQRRPDVPSRLAEVLDAALDDRDELRFASAAEFRAELERAGTTG